MQRRFYVDTSIWRDYFEDRNDGIRPLGEFAFGFLKKCRENGEFVIVSNAVKKELLDYLPKEKVSLIFSGFRDTIIEIDYSKKQAEEAFAFWINHKRRFPVFDVLHSIIARDNKAILVTRDRHFEEIGIAECRSPEELL
ncbi:MAG: PIN domain-containing protein [archaeon]